LLDSAHGAQRASHRLFRSLLAALLGSTALLALIAAPAAAASHATATARAANPSVASAAAIPSTAAAASAKASTAKPSTATTAQPKVVLVVGPVGPSTAEYIADARRLAEQAREDGAAVTELYSPNATWARVAAATKGANLLIYLGHGNGWPSPYPGIPAFTNGMGLNASAGHGNDNVRYYGETYVESDIHLAANAVVILNHLCYASGNNEWGAGNPTKAVAIARVDNYGASFMKAGARAVFAEGITDPAYILDGLFRSDSSMSDLFWSSSSATHRWSFAFDSKKTAGAMALMDPYAPNRYYRSVIGDLSMTAAEWRAGD